VSIGTARAALPVRSDVDLMAVREAARGAAADAGFSLVNQTKLVTAVSELARNAVVHGGGGEVLVEPVQATLRGVRLVVSDHGPGIADIDQALTDGHTTGQGLGLGLGGARRLVDEFRIESVPGAGTTVTITMWAAPIRSVPDSRAPGARAPGLPPIRPRMSLRP
jgi:serine/threonine-protein kinase RsbT